MKHTLALLLALATVVPMLVACGGGNTESTADNGNVATVTTEAVATEPPEYTKPTVNYEGGTVTVATH